MASFNGFTPADSDLFFAGKRAPPRSGAILEQSSVTTYQYRILATGVTGETTSLNSIPSGAVVIGIITT